MNDTDVTDTYKLCRVAIKVQNQWSYKIMAIHYLLASIHKEANNPINYPIKINTQA